MATVELSMIDDWVGDVTAAREQIRKISRAILALEEALLRLQVQLRDESAPTLLDSLKDEVKE